MYPPRFTTNEDVAAAKAVARDLFNASCRGARKLAQILSFRRGKTAKTTLEKPLNHG